MSCDECLPLVEEYVDGELKGLEAERLTAHLSRCASCAEAVDELVREQEVYARYQREVEVTPALWHAVRTRIEEEKAQPSNTATGWRAWLAETFGMNARLRPAYTMALILLAVAITSVAVYRYLNSRHSQQPLAGQTGQPRDIPKEVTPVEAFRPDLITIPNSPGPTATNIVPNKKPPLNGVVNNRRQAVIASPLPRSGNSRSAALTLDEVERTAALTVARDESTASMPEQPNDPEMQLARHVEQAQMLLRSFKNVRLAETSHAPDISYEKEQARKLLYRNIILRREAATQGNTPAEKLLAALEPILLDIANLPDHPTDADVSSIEQRMRKKEIMAALQVHTIVTQESY